MTQKSGLVARLALVLALLATVTDFAKAAVMQRGNDSLRTGWYPDQTSLTPQVVSGGTFGQLFSTAVTGQVYAQPLVANGTVFVATEANWIYGINATSGSIVWSRNLGTPWNPADLACSDLTPSIGITGTPVIDDVANTAYFTSKSYASGTTGAAIWQMHAVDLSTGSERTGFPVTIQGSAQNAPLQTFNPTKQHQRPALLLMNGVVYAAFGGHCDSTPYEGWVAGVSTSGSLVALWSARGGDSTMSGAGIWMSGAGLVSDRTGSIFFATGNAFGGGSPSSPTPGNQPPAGLGQSVVRVDVQPDNTLKAVDFFAPFDAPTMDTNDADLGAGGPVALPSQYFGTPSIPNLMVQIGKQGYLYVLNRDSLGGTRMGTGGGDAVVNRISFGGVWSHPAVWPGDGGYIYVAANSGTFGAFKYGLDGSGNPTFSQAGNTGTDKFGFGSSPPIVTSNGVASGTALVWIVWSPDGTGTGAQLRAYNPVPQAGVFTKVFAAPVGQASKFAPPTASNNRIYVGTRDGHLIAFGAPINTPLTASAVNFPNTIVGQTSVQTATLTATGNVTVSALASSDPQFTLGAPSQALPASLTSGQTLTVPVTFAPTKTGLVAGVMNVTTGTGTIGVALNGQGLSPNGVLSASPMMLSFGGTVVGGVLTGSVTFSNTGGTALTIMQVTPPAAPFSATGLPAVNSTLAPGASITASVTFAPTAVGQFTSSVTVVSSNGTESPTLSGSAAPPGVLTISPLSLDYGTIALGASKLLTFNVSNTGGSTLTITKSKPPALGQFKATSALAEGTQIPAGQTVALTVSFAPTAGGSLSDTWLLNCDQPGSSLQTVTFAGKGDPTGTVTVPAPVAGGWKLNGNASLLGTTASSLLQLTPPTTLAVGSAFWPTAVPSANLTAAFDATIANGTGADGLTFVMADPSKGATPSSLGSPGSSMGFSGIPGWAVALVTYQPGTPTNFVGISNGGAANSSPNWVATTKNVPALRPATHHVQVAMSNGTMTVSVDNVAVLTKAVTLPPSVLVGFTGGNGGMTDQHAVANVVITSSGAAPGVLSMTPSSLTFGNVAVNASVSKPVSISNTGGSPISISSTTSPAAPFTVAGLPAMGTVLAAGQTITATVTYAPTALTSSTDTLAIASSVGNASVSLSGTGTAPPPGVLSVTPASIAFGSVSIGSSTSQQVKIANTGGSALTINGITSPAAPFTVTGLPAAGSSLAPNQIVTATVTYAPTAALSSTDALTIASSVGNATTSLSGTGVNGMVIPDPAAGGWKLNGNASLLGSTPGSLLQLNPPSAVTVGSAFWPTAVPSANLTAAFDATIGGGNGADGMTFVMADPAAGATPSSLGSAGGGLGFAGIPGWAVGLVTFSAGAPANFVGISNGGPAGGSPNWVATTTNVPALRPATHHVQVAMSNGTMTVSVDNVSVLQQTVTLPPNVLVGFSGGSGGMYDQHAVANVVITTAQAAGALSVTPSSIPFGNVTVNTSVSKAVSISNTGGTAITISSTTSPAAPFSVTGLPAAGATLAAGQTVTATVTYAPTATASSTNSLTIASSVGNATVSLSGTGVAPAPGVLSVTPSSIAFGNVTTNSSVSKPVSISNTGGSPITINSTTSPASPFTVSGLPAAGATLAAGQTVTATVTYAPTAAASSTGTLTIASSVGNGSVSLSGTGVSGVSISDPTAGGWTLNGNASLLGTTPGSLLQLNPASAVTVGSAFWPTAVPSANLTATFDATIGGGNGADGMTFVMADPSAGATPTSLGSAGGGLGFAGIPGWAVGLVTFSAGAPANFVGISNGGPSGGSPNWVATTTNVPALRPATHHVQVAMSNGTMTVSVDNVAVLTQAVTLPSNVLVGFTGGSGGMYDQHAVANVVITTSAAAPAPGVLSVTPTSLPFGTVSVNTSSSKTVSIANTGGSAITINSTTSPAAPFSVTGLPAAGSTLAAGQAVTATVTYAPTAATSSTDSLTIASSAGNSTVSLSGTGANGVTVPDPTAGGWTLNGNASLLGTTPGSLLQLTPASAVQAGSAFWPTAIPSAKLTATFDATIGSGNGADGLTFVMADPSAGATPTSLGGAGSGLGFVGIPGWAVGLVTFSAGAPANFAGITNGGPSGGSPNWVATTNNVPALRPATHHVQVSMSNGTMTVTVDNVAVITQAVTLPANVLVGFTGGTGGMYDQHAVANVSIVSGP